MVAIRQTHNAGFDFEQWIEELQLSDEYKNVISRTNAFVLKCIRKTEVEDDFVNAEDLVSKFNHVSSEIVVILMNLNMDLASLQVAILYPAFESGFIKIEDILSVFDPKIATLVMAVKDMEAIRSLQTLNSERVTEEQVDRVRRMLLAMVKDVRAVVIKLAERIATIRAAKNENAEYKISIAKEISNVYAPLANRLGIGQLKWELEDLAFKYLHPQEYKEIARDLGERRIEREQYIEDFVSNLTVLLKENGIEGKVYGRPKHIYSIYKKMVRKHVKFSEIYDARAVRVLVDSIEKCYATLGVIHTAFEHIPKEFDDYIANPKSNGYQSIHTVVYGKGHKVVEIQIRTDNMHQSAELGVAAHWKYKEGNGQSHGVEERINWLRKLLSWRDDMLRSGSLQSEFHNQVFEDRIYVFTPNGEVIDLPTGATPLDFAYQVHTMVGHCCIGAKVDGRIVPYTYHLKTGEQVEIITSKTPNPSRDWINLDNGFIKTNKARNKIQAYFRKVDFDKNCQLGQEILDRELSRVGLDLKKEQLHSLLKMRLSKFNLKTVNDLFANIGAGDIGVNIIVSFISEQLDNSNNGKNSSISVIDELISHRSNAEQRKKSHKSDVIVSGLGDIMTHMAKCCQPIPGDEILGFVTQGRGIAIHRCDCEKFTKMAQIYPERVVDAVWGDNAEESSGYHVTIRVIAEDYPLFLRDITSILANEKMDVLGIKSKVDKDKNTCLVDLELLVVKIAVLNRVLKKLADLPKVSSVKRV